MTFEKLKDPQVQGALRHLLTTLGGALAARGIVDEVFWNLAVGVVIAAIGLWASWDAPEKKIAKRETPDV